MLSKEKIEEIKKKVKIQEVDEDVLEKNRWLNITHLYIKINRSIYEELLLFDYSINFLRKINDNDVKELIEKNKQVVDGCNEYLTDYIIGQKWRLETFGAMFAEEKKEEMHGIIELVFGILLKEDESEMHEFD